MMAHLLIGRLPLKCTNNPQKCMVTEYNSPRYCMEIQYMLQRLRFAK